MDDYKMGFLLLYNAITDALRALEARDVQTSREILNSVQKKVDAIYTAEEEK